MSQGIQAVPRPNNEPVRGYEAGSADRAALQAELDRQSNQIVEIPVIIGGKEIRTGKIGEVRSPHNHSHVLARYHEATPDLVEEAVAAADDAWRTWSELDHRARASLYLRMADLLVGPHRYRMNAATMLGQSKTSHQAEIESACEFADMLRFNAYFLDQLVRQQPVGDPDPGVWNYLEYRALEGFIFAVSPFNFTALGGNLAMAPAIMGNTIVWKPAETQMLSAYYLMELYREAGLPDGVVNMLPGHGPTIGAPALAQETLAGVHFTGSTATFQHIWKTVGENIANYRSYPRVVGETGGKNFVVAHESADSEALVANLIRGAYEFQGQKCSAASRAYLPASMRDEFLERFLDEAKTVTMGDPTDFSNFMGAVIDERSFNKISGYLDIAREDPSCTVLMGGSADRSVGWFVEPTLVVTDNPENRLMKEEIFGPVLAVYFYPDNQYGETLDLCRSTSPYGLTGAIFANDRLATEQAYDALRHAAGNFYINDKPTGAVIGQQPFGGGRASGTNDKTGLGSHLLRWTNIRTVKENFAPAKDYRYPFLSA